MKTARLLVLSLSVVAACAWGQSLPDLGETSESVVSPQAERRLGDTIMREIRASRQIVDDDVVQFYLDNLGARLGRATEPPLRPQFFALRDSSVNAFALPGGHVGVHTGLILTAESEAELASVLSHEIAHVSQRHLARLIARDQQSYLTSLAALAVAILASRSNPQVSNAAISAAQATMVQNQLDYTREYEREADRVGVQILERSGFDVRAMPTFFERLQRYNRLYDNNAPEYLRTHPITTERIADIQNRVEQRPYHQSPDSLGFQLVRARLRALDASPLQAVNFFDQNLREKKYANETAQRYGLVVSLLRARNVSRARQEFAILQRSAPASPIIDLLSAEIAAEAGDINQALKQLRGATLATPAYRPLAYRYAQLLLTARQPEEALGVVSNLLKSNGRDGRLYSLQSAAYAALGKRLLQHKALAEAYYLQGDPAAAVEQLQLAARSNDGDFYQLSTVEARLKEMRAIDSETRKKLN